MVTTLLHNATPFIHALINIAMAALVAQSKRLPWSNESAYECRWYAERSTNDAQYVICAKRSYSQTSSHILLIMILVNLVLFLVQK